MVGLERTVLPLLAEEEFGLASSGAVLSFIATFGLVKAATNFFAGRLGDLYGRRRVLIAGWLMGLPVPLLIIWAPTWAWVVFANVLLGVNQGLTWSTTVIMKIDIVGARQRGLAMGLNEFAGYLAVAVAALATGYLAESYGLRPEPFYLGIAVAAVGLALSLFFVRETRAHAVHEMGEPGGDHPAGPRIERVAEPAGRRTVDTATARDLFTRTSWRDPALSSACQAGLVNNLNDGLAWGLFPLYFAAAGLSVDQIGVLAFTYPAVWGIVQLATGALSDRIGRKGLIAGGMCVQGAALAAVSLGGSFAAWLAASALLGVGTAMVYPTLLAAIGDVAAPSWRGTAVGIYRLWRDGGYAAGALLAGVLADAAGIPATIIAVAGLTIASGIAVLVRMPETLVRTRQAAER